ncbi:MAG TPA: cytochrome c [Candidatus Dormibacteraeota bacterium]|jgi:mono/diheme cytochrome c family protein|nr:cytochrome c [Candidatus Dormibacteraeota bacterium]
MLRPIRFIAWLVLASILLCSSARAEDKAAASYRKNCVACHGADGKAQTAAAKSLGARSFASPEVAKMSDADLTSAIEKGKGKMPSYGKSMKPDEIRAMVAYVRSLSK